MKKQLSEKQKEQIKNASKVGRDRIAKFRKGKTYDEIYGKEKADKIRKKMKKENAWNSGKSSKEDNRILSGCGHPRFGEILSPTIREKISKSLKMFYKTPEGGISRANSIIRFSKQIIPKQDSKIEIKIQELLKINNIEFVAHKYFGKLTSPYRCDIFVPEKNLIIECDGCYWHGCRKCFKDIRGKAKNQRNRDKTRTKELNKLGYNVIRLPEHEINKDIDGCFKKISEIQYNG